MLKLTHLTLATKQNKYFVQIHCIKNRKKDLTANRCSKFFFFKESDSCKSMAVHVYEKQGWKNSGLGEILL